MIVVIEMKLLIIIIIQFIELFKVVLENLQYLSLLQLHSPFPVCFLEYNFRGENQHFGELRGYQYIN